MASGDSVGGDSVGLVNGAQLQGVFQEPSVTEHCMLDRPSGLERRPALTVFAANAVAIAV
jgi:hypothetical protein